MTKKEIKVNMTAFKKKNDDELNMFASTLVENGKDKDFDVFRATLDLLTTEAADYAAKLLKAQNKGQIEVTAKDDAKDTLLNRITEYAYYITGATIYTPEIIVKSGFVPTSTARTRQNPDLSLAAPFALKVQLGTSSGEVKLSFSLEDPRKVLKNALEWSDDNGLTWNSGTYFTGKRYLIKGLPVRKDLLLRVRSLGTYSRESDFSVPIAVYLP